MPRYSPYKVGGTAKNTVRTMNMKKETCTEMYQKRFIQVAIARLEFWRENWIKRQRNIHSAGRLKIDHELLPVLKEENRVVLIVTGTFTILPYGFRDYDVIEEEK